EDGIRDFHVTGVQTCALPIWGGGVVVERRRERLRAPAAEEERRPVRGDDQVHPRRLPRRERVYARVVGGVHEVVDGVGAAAGAAVEAAGRAADGDGARGGRVADLVAGDLAAGRLVVGAPAEGVEEAEVVAHLVDGDVALDERRGVAARAGLVADDGT